ncbi:hypothetical protein EHJ37_19635 [Vibrio parahaemolyticus]|nr:hypothetical protein [Vibrio parahaemolyticus]
MRYITTFLLTFFVSIQVFASEDADFDSTYNLSEITTGAYTDDESEISVGPQYESIDEVFDSYLSRIIASAFGKESLKSYLYNQTTENVINEIMGLDDDLYRQYLLPFNPDYAKIVNLAGIVFVYIPSILILILSSKFLIERLIFTYTTDEKEGFGFKSAGAMHLVRVGLSLGVLVPMTEYYISHASDEDALSNLISQSPLNRGTLMFIGDSVSSAEAISNEFAFNDSLYNPAYNVPSPDYVANEMAKINNFASCVASENSSTNIEVKSHVSGVLDELAANEMNGFQLEYIASYKNCSLKISTIHDKTTIVGLGNEKLATAVGINDVKFAKAVEDTFKEELDTYVKLALNSAMIMAEKMRNDDDEFTNDLTLNLAGWYKQCDSYTANATDSSLSLAENLAAFKALPLCFSRSFIKKFSYPSENNGQDFDEQRMSDEDLPIGSRWIQVCDRNTTDPTKGITKTSDEIISCARQACSFDSNNTSVFACSALVNSVAKFLNIDEVTRGGVLMAPVLAQKQLDIEIPDDAKNYLKKLKSESSRFTENPVGMYSTRDSGDIIYSTQIKLGESDKEKIEEKQKSIEKTLFMSVESVGSPDFNENSTKTIVEAVTSGVTRFSYCLQHRGEYSERLGVCGNSYQEASKLVQSYVNLVAISYAITMMPSLSKFKKGKGFGKIGAAKNFTGSAKKVMVGMLAGAGVASVINFVVSDDEMNEIIEYFMPEPDPFTSAAYIHNIDAVSKGILAAFVIALNGDGLVVNGVRLALAGVFILFCTFSYLPALLFVSSMAMAILNLIVFIITLPIQLVNAFSDTGRQAGQNIRVLTGKWLITIFRIPLIVAAFYLSFIVFDSLLPSLNETAEALSIKMEISGIFAQFAAGLVNLLMQAICVVILLYICLNATNQFYQVIKSYLVEGHGQENGADDFTKAIDGLKRMR